MQIWIREKTKESELERQVGVEKNRYMGFRHPGRGEAPSEPKAGPGSHGGSPSGNRARPFRPAMFRG